MTVLLNAKPVEEVLKVTRHRNGNHPETDPEIASLRRQIADLEMKLALFRRRELLDLQYHRELSLDQRRRLIAPIIDLVSREFFVPREEILKNRGRQRTPDHISIPRMLAATLAHQIHKINTTDVAHLMGYREHSMICHAKRATENRIDTDPDFAARVKRIRTVLAAMMEAARERPESTLELQKPAA